MSKSFVVSIKYSAISTETKETRHFMSNYSVNNMKNRSIFNVTSSYNPISNKIDGE